MLAIVDTGPLVASFDRVERYHRWASDKLTEIEAPLLVCEPVLVEAMHLLAGHPAAQDTLLDYLRGGALRIAFHVEEHVGPLQKLLRKYRDVPMSLADACIVRMSEIYDQHAVFTLDSDFSIYRKHSRSHIDVIHPEAE